jgi:hypothetical protein
MAVSNKIKYPQAWAFYIEHARNMMEEEDCKYNYRIPKPNMSGDFIYADKVEHLWSMFIRAWHDPRDGLNSPSLYGKIQYIVETFK